MGSTRQGPTRPRPKPKKRNKKRSNKTKGLKIDSHQTLLKERELFLYKAIDEETSEKLIKDLKTLNMMDKKPITLYINSPGGKVSATLAIINTIKSIKSKVITVINTMAASGAALVSISGDERFIVNNGAWMMHDLNTSITNEYGHIIEDRAAYLKIRFQQLEEVLKTNTDLTKKEINKIRHGELWLFPEEALDKGVIDKILEPIK